MLGKLYPKSSHRRLNRRDPILKKTQRHFFKAAGTNFALFQILFLGLFSWVFAALFQQNTHTHNISVVLVDYDGGAIGAAIRDAYSRLQSQDFPTLTEKFASDFATAQDLENAVCRTDYWAALYIAAGSSDRLEAALSGGDNASSYQTNDVLTYIWNEALYSAVVDSAISSNLQTLSSAARLAYTSVNGTGRVQQVSSPEALSVFAEPWVLQNVNIQPTTQGSRAVYNTLVIILVMIQEFFYLGTINGLYAQLKVYSRAAPYRIIAVRNIISLAYCFIGSLCTTGAIWAFKSGWDVNGGQFVLSWLALWLFAHLTFLVLDVFTIWLPPSFVPMALISWVIFNVSSILLPFELSPGFFKIGYAAPAHEVYQILIDIWSSGCNPKLYFALPIMIVYEILGLVLGAVGVFRRCHYATLQEDEQARQFKERVDAAVEFERQREKELKQHTIAETQSPTVTGEEDSKSEAAEDDDASSDPELRAGLSRIISKATSHISRQRSRTNRGVSYGPAFELPFGGGDDDSDRLSTS